MAKNDDDPFARRHAASEIGAAYDVPVRVSTVIGKSQIQVAQLMRLTRGAVLELDRKVGEPVDIYVNNRLVARGELVVVDENLGVTITEVVKSGTIIETHH
ncbi:flagellar motor switch protein FliN [Thalassospira alkalitolerans]|uniref:Flagellar motor switch protein FliN n=1 Tax=Thalassospira alkalitolerans TaxID=1293890 RepID=A0A1Y2L8J1_9PROT|nr:flagellar motor switch protein FliN [Thalassospira alkalitolerans]OSQ42672.1 flagellar motor switch protein FliN [Thalassospira alkalitolerans]|tara:strand:- start:16521 stop:16823 length:303 start_codon:yes stop_codon:yes gene_type:complete